MRTRAIGPPADIDPLFITLGQRRLRRADEVDAAGALAEEGEKRAVQIMGGVSRNRL